MIPVANWPLVGRGEEMKLIADALSGGTDYAGVVIAGRAGVGKTRLLGETLSVAGQRGWTVRSIAGSAAAQAIPLGPLAQWAAADTGNEPAGLIAAVIAALTDSPDGAPVLLAVDDAHLLDEQSSFVVSEVVRRRLAVVVATVRTGQRASETMTALWKDGHLRRMDLQPLSRTQSDTLLENALGGRVDADTADQLWDLTRGNTLFLRELVRQESGAGRLSDTGTGWRWAGGLSASATLIDLIDLYVGTATESALEVLDLVSVAEPLDLAHLAGLVGPDAIDEAVRRELITVTDTAGGRIVRPSHPLYGEVRRGRLAPMRAAQLRGRLAAAMSRPARGAHPVDPARLGLLWLESDLPGDAGVFSTGALAAFRRLDLNLTHRLAEAAVAAGAGIEARLLLAQALLRMGRPDDAELSLAGIDARPPDFVWIFVQLVRAASLLFSRALPEQSWAVIDDALAAVPDEPSLLALRVVHLALAARPAEAVAVAESIDRDRLPALPALILACGLTVAHGDLGHPRESAEAAAAGNRVAAQSPEASYQAIGLNITHADALVSAGCIHQALALGEQIAREWADIPGVPNTVKRMIAGLAALAHGDVPAALSNLRAAITEAEAAESRAGFSGLTYLLWVAHTEALARAGQLEAALEAQTRMRDRRHPAYRYTESAVLHAESWVAAARGHSSEAIALVTQAADFAREHGQLTREVRCLQTAIQFGAKPDGDRLARLAGLVDDPRAALVARWAEALAGNDGDAVLEVSAQLEAMGDRIAAADAAAQAAGAFEQDNRRGSRLTAAGRATRLIAECGASTPATRSVLTPLPLSGREREIAALVGEGLSNRQIAEALTMSVRTVEGHIYRACTKLGTANRAELGRLVAEFGGRPLNPA